MNTKFANKANDTENYKARNKASLIITGKTNFTDIYPQLLDIACQYKDRNLPCPSHGEFYKPCTQLTNIKEYMEVIPSEYISSLIDALQFIDAAWNIIHFDTRGSNVYNIVSDSIFNNCLIGYEHTAFGRVNPRNQNNKWNALYQTVCSMSNLRHVCKKAAKMIFTYYLTLAAVKEDPLLNTHEDVQYIIGAVQYAIDTYNLFSNGKSTTTSYFVYVWTLATFFNGFHSFTEDDANSAIPCRYIFTNMRKYRGLDTFTKVNNAVAKKFFETKEEIDSLFPEDGFKCAFEYHSYSFPQCATPIARDEEIVFYDPHDVRTDIPSTKAFINTMVALKEVLPNKDFRVIFNTLDQLDSFETDFLVAADTKIDCTPNPYYETLEQAEHAAMTIYIPDDIKTDKVWFSCMVITGTDRYGNTCYELRLINRAGNVYDADFNLIKEANK